MGKSKKKQGPSASSRSSGARKPKRNWLILGIVGFVVAGWLVVIASYVLGKIL